jgi:sugar phosphate isomerase/epimerase
MPDQPISPRIQCSTGPFWAFELEATFDAAAEAGFTELELMVTRDPATQGADAPARLARERGMRIAAVHGPFLTLTRGVWSPDPLAKIRRGVEMCRALESDSFIVHPPFVWERSYARWLEHDAPGFVADTGVVVAVETMYPIWLGGRRLKAYQWVEPLELARSAHHVVMDTSHVAVARLDVMQTLSILRDKLVHVHLSNNAGDGRDGHLELDTGVVPVDPFLTELARTEYTGAVSLELSVRRYLERPRELVEALRRNREYVESKLERDARLKKELRRQ